MRGRPPKDGRPPKQNTERTPKPPKEKKEKIVKPLMPRGRKPMIKEGNKY